jgi:hypothetical protein
MVRHTLVINGIMGKPSLATAWTDRRARFIQLHTSDKAVAVENHFWLIRTQKRLKHYAGQLAIEIREYNRAGIVPDVEAHSNGNVLVLMALHLDSSLKIGNFTMLFPAAYASFEDNGINQYLEMGQIKTVLFVGSKTDGIVRWGGGLTSWARRFSPYGYGTLSVDGPQDVCSPLLQKRITEVWRDGWGHSTFSEPERMDKFFDDIYSTLRVSRT